MFHIYLESTADKHCGLSARGMRKTEVRGDCKGLGLSIWKDGLAISEWGDSRKEATQE